MYIGTYSTNLIGSYISNLLCAELDIKRIYAASVDKVLEVVTAFHLPKTQIIEIILHLLNEVDYIKHLICKNMGNILYLCNTSERAILKQQINKLFTTTCHHRQAEMLCDAISSLLVVYNPIELDDTAYTCLIALLNHNVLNSCSMHSSEIWPAMSLLQL